MYVYCLSERAHYQPWGFKMIRVLVAANDSGSREEVVFTEELKKEGESFFFMKDMTITTDELLEIDTLPSYFPLDYVLKRE